MKKVIALVIFVLMSFASYIGYQKFKSNEFIDTVTPHLKNTSLRVTNGISHELDVNSKITFKEIFNKLEEDIAEMEKRKLEIQTITNETNKDISSSAVEYIKASQAFTRSSLSYSRKLLAKRSASDWMDRKMEEYKAAAGSYSREYERKSATQAIDDFTKASLEFLDAAPEVLESAKALKTSREIVARTFQNDSLIPQDKLDELIKKFSPKNNR